MTGYSVPLNIVGLFRYCPNLKLFVILKKFCKQKKMLSEFKIYQPIQFGIFLTFATIKIAGETKQQNLISARIEYLEPHYLHSHLCMVPGQNMTKLGMAVVLGAAHRSSQASHLGEKCSVCANYRRTFDFSLLSMGVVH